MAQKNVYKLNLLNSNYYHSHYDQCTFPKCSYIFQEADWTYFGIDTKADWHHVCETHRESIDWAELQLLGHLSKDKYRVEPYSIPFYKSPPGPNTDLWLWRYMDLEKFKDFIETKSIFFAKATSFGDNLECAVSIKDQKNWLYSMRATAYEYFYEQELTGMPIEEKTKVIEKRIQREILDNKEFRKKVLISCWHANDYESEAMWQLYKGYDHQTIAVSINLCNLRHALPKPIHIGEVSYVDYEKVYPTKVRVFRKHVSYEHEREVRAVIFPEHIQNKDIETTITKRTDKGCSVKLQEGYLQIRVYISPWSDNHFRRKVRSLLNKSNWNKGNSTTPSIIDVIETRYKPVY